MERHSPPRFYRYSDLVSAGIVNNRMTLSRRIKNDGFPSGVLLGPNSVAYPAEQVDRWVATRPTRAAQAA